MVVINIVLNSTDCWVPSLRNIISVEILPYTLMTSSVASCNQATRISKVLEQCDHGKIDNVKLGPTRLSVSNFWPSIMLAQRLGIADWFTC